MNKGGGADWLERLPPAMRPVLERCAAGELSPVMALMHLAWESEGADLAPALADAARQAPGEPRLQALARLARENPAGLDLVRRVRESGVDHGPSGSLEEGIASARAMFDRIAAFSPEGGSALYALGSPAILDAATGELLAVLRSWIPLAGRDLLDIGCGAGRVEAALAHELASATGVDVSAAMLAAARARCAASANVGFRLVSGHGLEGLPSAGFDVALAVDCFPYLVRSGMALAARYLAEAARVLRPGGDLAIFNFSYRGDDEADRRDLTRLAGETGFTILRNGTRPFELWDAAGFHLRLGP